MVMATTSEATFETTLSCVIPEIAVVSIGAAEYQRVRVWDHPRWPFQQVLEQRFRGPLPTSSAD